MDEISGNYLIATNAEITLEANPESVQIEHLIGYRSSGINRLSIGVQSLNAVELKFLDRGHTGHDALVALENARHSGFDNINVDLIYGLPEQKISTWQETLTAVSGQIPDHISCYGLTVEPNTPLAVRTAAGAVKTVDNDLAADMTDWTDKHLADVGYAQYEISNFSLPSRECIHNLVYWRHQEYIGLGPGAHGFINGLRYSVEKIPSRYIERLRQPKIKTEKLPSPAIVETTSITNEMAALDATVMGLRLNTGVDTIDFKRTYGTAWDRFEDTINWAIASDLLEKSGNQLHLTRQGRRLANEVFIRLMDTDLV